jgi:hypothetical protein
MNRGKRPVGRPPKPIDWDFVEELLMSGSHGTEIASHFDMHHNTFYEAVQDKYGLNFTELKEEKREKGNSLIRMKQFQKALGITDTGDNTLLIWLGKNRLSQTDEKATANITPEVFEKFTQLMQMSTNRQEALKMADNNKSKE